MSSVTYLPTTSESDGVQVDLLDYFHDYLMDPTWRIKPMQGGAGSGKSFSVSQHLCLLFLSTDDLVITPVRKYRPSLKRSSWRLLKDQLRAWGLRVGSRRDSDVLENKQDLTLTYEPTGAIIDGLGLDDHEKIKSYETNIVWAEEATELTKEDFMQLDLRCRRTTKTPDWDKLREAGVIKKRRKGPMPNELILTYNPIDGNHWIIRELIEGSDPRVGRHYSTYLNNPHLDEATVTQIENLINLDENWYRVYAKGLPGVLKDLIFTTYEVIPFSSFPLAIREKENEPTAYGEDYGFNNPSAVLAGWEHDRTWYIHEILYQKKLTNRQLMAAMEDEGVSHNSPIYADSAEPDRIEEQCQGFEGKLEPDDRVVDIDGFNVLPADKRSVKESIDLVKSVRLVISAESVNTLREIHGYKYRRTKEDVVLDEPVPFNDHAMAAIRYLIYSSRQESDPEDYEEAKTVGGTSVPAQIIRKVDEDAYAGMQAFGGSSLPF
ncbi:MAG: phage terminase large subunit [Actinomycetia bacterium]|nr:phage terminase large subunit [Actinomycetes bacterium]